MTTRSRSGSPLASGSPQSALLVECFEAAVAAADAGRVVPAQLPEPPAGRILIVAVGKAAIGMATAAVDRYDGRAALSGTVVVPHGQARPVPGLEVIEAGHPVPDEDSVRAGERVLSQARRLGEDDLLLALVSGGGSALLCAPAGLTLGEKVRVNRSLLRSGAPIEEINVVRKHLSEVKGGRLALAASPAHVVALVLSDVVGDDLASVASGPTVPDPSTFGDALEVVSRYGIDEPAVIRTLREGAAGNRPETPKPGATDFARVTNRLIASNELSLRAASRLLTSRGIASHLLSSAVTGEAREAGRMHGAIVRQVLERGEPFRTPCALLSGGETTVTVRGGGRGGRNSEFALGLALGLPAGAPVHALIADSDGRDGSESNAGVLITPQLLSALDRAEARRALEANDSHSVFARHGCLFDTGPTGTNVNDLRFILVGVGDEPVEPGPGQPLG